MCAKSNNNHHAHSFILIDANISVFAHSSAWHIGLFAATSSGLQLHHIRSIQDFGSGESDRIHQFITDHFP